MEQGYSKELEGKDVSDSPASYTGGFAETSKAFPAGGFSGTIFVTVRPYAICRVRVCSPVTTAAYTQQSKHSHATL